MYAPKNIRGKLGVNSNAPGLWTRTLNSEDVLKKVNPYITAANMYPTKNTPRVRSRWPTWRLPVVAGMRSSIDRGEATLNVGIFVCLET